MKADKGTDVDNKEIDKKEKDIDGVNEKDIDGKDKDSVAQNTRSEKTEEGMDVDKEGVSISEKQNNIDSAGKASENSTTDSTDSTASTSSTASQKEQTTEVQRLEYQAVFGPQNENPEEEKS